MLGTFIANASTVHVPEALEIARKFFIKNSSPNSFRPAPFSADFVVAHTAVDKQGDVDYYVINRSNDAGYVVVSGDDAIIPVIGYADEGKFDTTEVPESMQWWLNECQREIQYLKQHPEKARGTQGLSKAVKPLVTSLWAQGTPYNAKCPTYIMGYTAYRSATGCVATAIAQIMNYHKWPNQGTGEHSYNCNVNGASNATQLHADFSTSVYDWGNILDAYEPDNYTTDQKNAVALLMSDVGISVDMGYGSSSGAFSPAVVSALTSYFKYDKSMRLCSREDYSVEAWEQMIRNELDNNRPVYYSGMSSTGGHAFVCDGYNHEGYYHFNWGWGGRGNGYFLLSMLNPNNQEVGTYNTGYNSLQEIIINIMPDQGLPTASTSPLSASCAIAPVNTTVSLGEAASFNVNQACIAAGAKDWSTLYWGIVATVPDINATTYVDGFKSLADASSVKLGGGYSLSGLTYTPSKNLAEGLYYIRFAYLKDNGEFGLFNGTSPTNYVVDMRVKDGKATFTPHYEQSNISMSDLTMTPPYVGQKMQVGARIINNDTKDFFDNIYVALLKDGKQEQISEPILISLAPGQSVQVSTVLSLTVSADNYTLVMLDNCKTKKAEAGIAVINGGGTPSLRLVRGPEASAEMPASDIKATAVVSNTGGTFAGQLELMVVNSKNTILEIIKSPFVSIYKNENVTVNFSGSFGGLLGETYYLALRNPAITNSNTVWGSLVPFKVCDEPSGNICDVNGDGEVDVADINAVMVCILEPVTDQQKARADVNGDGEVDIADVNTIVKFIIGL